MQEIIIKVSNEKYRYWSYFLKNKYGSKKRNINNLAKLAIMEIISIQAGKELKEAEKDAA